MKTTGRWFSQRLHRDMTMVRWGTFGQPVLLFPTAGGDAEEVERFWMMKVLAPLIDAGRIKVYSCDSAAGQPMVNREGSPAHRQWVLNQFHQYVRHEVVPAIRADCKNEQLEVIRPRARSASRSICRATSRAKPPPPSPKLRQSDFP